MIHLFRLKPQTLGKPCKSDPMLHFSFDSDFNDVSCTKATSVKYGVGSEIVKKGKKAYACFSGSSHLEVSSNLFSFSLMNIITLEHGENNKI